MRFPKLFLPVLILGVLVTAVGCDSGDDDGESEAELFVDAWAAVGVADGTGDQTPAFAQDISEFTVTFQSTTYSLSVVFTDERSPIQFSGATYSVDEGADQITIVIPAAATGATDIPVVFGYAFSGDENRVDLTVASAQQVVLVNTLFETTYEAPVTLTLQRQ